MNISFITEHSLWWVILCFVFSVLFSFFTYWKRFPENITKIHKYILYSTRFLVAFLISFLILNPLLLLLSNQEEKPLIIVAHDNSQSIILTADSNFYKNDFPKSLENQIDILEENFEIRKFQYDSEVNNEITYNYDGSETDISLIISKVKDVFAGRNVGALVLTGDGIYNKGTNPYFLAQDLNFPIYTVLMGDTSVHKDLKINKVFHNKSVFRGNSFPVEINISASLLAGNKSRMQIIHKNKELFSKEINVNSNSFSETIRTYIPTDEAGILKYEIILQEIEGEHTTLNNKWEFFVEVMDRKDKILIVYSSPHPDISALQNSLSTSISYFVEAKSFDDVKNTNEEYELVILHQIPTQEAEITNFVQWLNDKKIPSLYIIGQNTDLKLFNRVSKGLQIYQNNKLYNDAFVAANRNFYLFNLEENIYKLLENMPPLLVPFGDYKLSNAANVLLYQRIGQVVSEMPLICFYDIDNQRSGVVAGEGIWRWRLMSYQINNEHNTFDDFVIKTAQYLMVSNDRSNLRINHKNLYNENESVIFTAELYNEAMERLNTPEIKMLITDENNNNYPFVFSRTENAYELNAGRFEEGYYAWKAQTQIGNNTYDKLGVFSTKRQQIESLNLTADKVLFQQLADLHDGEMLYAKNIDVLSEKIKNNPEIKPLMYKTKEYMSLSSLWFYFFTLLVLFTLEWYIRKYNGMY